MEIFEYAFMRRAFIVGILLAAVIPCIGLVIVCKRLSMIGDALSHTSLAGVAAGLILGLNPVLTAAATCVVAAIGIEAIRRKIPRISPAATPASEVWDREMCIRDRPDRTLYVPGFFGQLKNPFR